VEIDLPKSPGEYVHIDGPETPKAAEGPVPYGTIPVEKPEKLEIRLSDGRARKIKFISETLFFDAKGNPVATDDFIREMFGTMPQFFSTAEELRELWASPKTREELLERLADAGYGADTLNALRPIIDAEDCDLLDVLEYIAFNVEPVKRTERVQRVQPYIATLTFKQQDFVSYLSTLYINVGYEELGSSKLAEVLKMKYGSTMDGITALGGMDAAKSTFNNFQRQLYTQA
jgi:type I restriction enzyme R subunit